MIDAKTADKLDALLRMYYNSATTEGEKNNANSLFEKICKKHNIDADEYRRQSLANPDNSNIRSRARKEPSFDDMWAEFFWRAAKEAARNATRDRDRANAYRRRYEEAERRQKQKEEERRRAEEKAKQARSQSWGNNRWGSLEFEMKEPLWEIKWHNHKRVILLNTLVRAKGTMNRWGTQNFCIYSETFDPEQWFKNKESIYIIHSGKVQYFRDHYVVEKLWVVDSAGFEIEIPLK